MTGHRVLLALSALCSFMFLIWVLWFCRFGVDFRDEGFYFVWMADPFKYDYSLTQFGFIYHPLFELVGRSIVGIRRLNLLITFTLAWVLAELGLRSWGFAEERRVRLTATAGLAMAAVAYLHIWLPTPSYNWLTLQGLLIASMGLLLSDRASRYQTLFPILVGGGGWLCFMGKPTSAAGLALCALVYLAAARKLAWRPLLLAATLAALLLFASALIIDGSVPGFIERYRIGIRMAQIMMGDKNEISLLPRLGTLPLDPVTRTQIIGGVFALATIMWLAALRSRTAIALSQFISVVLAMATLLVVLGRLPKLLGIETYRGLLLGIIPLAALTALPFQWRQRRSGPVGAWPGVFLMMAMPVVYVLGTANNNWWQISHAAVFWAIGAAMLAAMPEVVPDSRRVPRVLVVSLATQFIMAAMVQTGVEAPYGQAAALSDQYRRVIVGPPGASLRLTSGFGDYLEEAQHKALEAGFSPGMPMLDLTGRSPTTLYAMRASSTAAPWVIGGYPGSERLASAMIERASCAELANAWLLHQPGAGTGIPVNVLEEFGANLDADYDVAATIVMSERFFGYPERWTQHLLKPRRPPTLAEADCFKARSAKP